MYAQILMSDKGFVAIYPIQHQHDYFLALKQFAWDVGMLDVLVCDSHASQKQCAVKEICTQIGTTLKMLEAETQWETCAELYVSLMKEVTWKDMHSSGLPLVLWDYCTEHGALIFQITEKEAVSAKWH